MSSPGRGSSPVDVPEYNTQFEPGPDDNETLWNVLEIIKEDKKRYLVKWEGVDPDTGQPWDPSWVPKRDCTDDLIFEWKLTKAKKDKVQKKRRKSNGEMAYDPKRVTKSHKAEKSKSNTGSSTHSHKSASTARLSRLPPDVPSGKVSPVVELVRHNKRRRDSPPLEDESEGFVTDGVPQLKKRREQVADQRDKISRSPASNINMGDNEVVSETESQHQRQRSKSVAKELGSQSSAQVSTRHQSDSPKQRDKPLSRDGSALHSNDANGIGKGPKDLDLDETDELRPEDALDGHDPPRPPIPTNLFSSAEVNYSLEANAALTQQSAFRLPVIGSPVRELNHALGLLNRKSEEIELLKVALKNHQSHTADLNGELVRLKRNLELAEERYQEVNTALNKERAAKVSQEVRVEESTATDLTTSSVEYPDSLLELHRENEELKLTKAQLESDTDMLRRLYAQASDAHQVRVVEIKALKQENDSLREQATKGVKQAHLFWTTQVLTLENELKLSKGAIELLTDQARRTDNDVRRRAALLPMAQREAEAAKQEIDDWKSKIMELGRENTKLRLEVKGWEDEAMIRRVKEQEMKEQESTLQDELVWMCSWMDNKHGTKCGALLGSREKLREHIYEAGHV